MTTLRFDGSGDELGERLGDLDACGLRRSPGRTVRGAAADDREPSRRGRRRWTRSVHPDGRLDLEVRTADPAALRRDPRRRRWPSRPASTTPSSCPSPPAWSTAPSPQRRPRRLRHWWRDAADLAAGSWNIEFAVIAGGTVIGAGRLMAKDVPARAHASRPARGWGVSTRAGATARSSAPPLLHLAFAGLGAAEATTGAWSDNGPSLGVTRRPRLRAERRVPRQAGRARSATCTASA